MFRPVLSAAIAVMSHAAAAVIETHRHSGMADAGFTFGGYNNRSHDWMGKRRKVKPRTLGMQPRRSKSQRRARAA